MVKHYNMQFSRTFLLITLIYVTNCKGALGDTSSNDLNPFQIVFVGVPESKTDEPFKDNSLMVKYTRQLEASYKWGSDLREKCGYKIKVEAVTVVQTITKVLGPPVMKSRYFVKIYIDNKLLDIVEHGSNVRFDDNVIKLAFFIHKIIQYSCEKLEIEYLMKGESCRARTYERQKLYRQEIGDKNMVFLEDWQWKAYDEDECENRKLRNLQFEFAKQLEKPPLVNIV